MKAFRAFLIVVSTTYDVNVSGVKEMVTFVIIHGSNDNETSVVSAAQSGRQHHVTGRITERLRQFTADNHTMCSMSSLLTFSH